MVITSISVEASQADELQSDEDIRPWWRKQFQAAAKIRAQGNVARVCCSPCTANKTTCDVSFLISQRCAPCIEAGIRAKYCLVNRADFQSSQNLVVCGQFRLDPKVVLPLGLHLSSEAIQAPFSAGRPETSARPHGLADAAHFVSLKPSLSIPYSATFSGKESREPKFVKTKPATAFQNARVNRSEAEKSRIPAHRNQIVAEIIINFHLHPPGTKLSIITDFQLRTNNCVLGFATFETA